MFECPVHGRQSLGASYCAICGAWLPRNCAKCGGPIAPGKSLSVGPGGVLHPGNTGLVRGMPEFCSANCALGSENAEAGSEGRYETRGERAVRMVKAERERRRVVGLRVEAVAGRSRDALRRFGWWVGQQFAGTGALAFLVASVILIFAVVALGGVLEGLTGDEKQAFFSGPTATPPGGSTPIQTATSVPTPLATRPLPTATPAPTAYRLRGSFDLDAVQLAALGGIDENRVELSFPIAGGVLSGNARIVWEHFPYGAVLAAIEEGIVGGLTEEMEAYQGCIARMIMEGPVAGSYDPASGAVSGSMTITSRFEDPTGCVAQRPKAFQSDVGGSAPTTLEWTGTFDTRQFTATIPGAKEGDIMAFSATVVTQ